VHTYLGQPGTAAQDDRDAVLVRSSTTTYLADANSWQLGRIAACDFRDPADVVVTRGDRCAGRMCSTWDCSSPVGAA
jgi:hypothetical protein